MSNVGRGGNVLIKVGLNAGGHISSIAADKLLGLKQGLEVNQNAILEATK